MKSSSVTILIPTLNEEQAIGPVIDELKRHGYTNIIVVDGHSTDHTREIAASKGAKVVLQQGRGKADAIRTGLKHVKTEYVLVMDGDHTYPAAEIRKLLEKTREADHVIGARKTRGNIPLLNRIGNRLITMVFNTLFGTSLTDVCSGMYLLKTELLREVRFETEGFSLEVEIAATTATTGRKIAETPIAYRKRIGESKLSQNSVKTGVKIAWDAVKLALKYNPVFLMFAAGSALTIPGAAIAAWVLYEYLFRGVNHFVWAILAVNTSTAGITSLMLATLALYLKRFEYRLNQKLRQTTTSTGGKQPLLSHPAPQPAWNPPQTQAGKPSTGDAKPPSPRSPRASRRAAETPG